MSRCPGRSTLERLLAGTTDEASRDDIEAHLLGCADCRGVLERLTRNPDSAPSAPITPPPEIAFLDRIKAEGPPSTVVVRPRPSSSPADSTPGRDATIPAAPPSIAGFRIIREVGRGGMGVVYEAIELALNRRVALKVLPARSLSSPTAAERFRREARSAARLHHTNIVPVFGVGEDGRYLYYAMQFIDGLSLDRVVDDLRGPLQSSNTKSGGSDTPTPFGGGSTGLSVDSSIRWTFRGVARAGKQAAEALAYAHAKGLVHRDIKPSNLILDERGDVWVADFGLAKEQDGEALTISGDIVGTLRYMAPEQFSGRSDASGDVYALGATLYELLTLRPAFEGSDRAHLIERVVRDEPARPRKIDPRIPRDLETIVLKAMAKRPADRYPTATALADDLRRFIADESILARRAGPVERSWRWSRRNPHVAALLSIVLVLLVSGLTSVTALWRHAVDLGRSEAVAHAASRRLSTQLAFDRGLTLGDTHEAGRGLHWMIDAIRNTKDDDLQKALRLNLTAWQTQVPIPLAILELPGPASSLSLASDSPVAIAGTVGLARLWEYRTGRTLGDLIHPGSKSPVFALLTRDGRIALTRCGTTGQLWDVAARTPIGSPLQHPGRILCASFAPDGRTLLTGSADGKGRLWDTRDGSAAGEPMSHDGQVTHSAFSPDGRMLITGSDDGTARLWDANNGRPIRTLAAHADAISALAFSPDGVAAAIGYGSTTTTGTVLLREVATARALGVPLRHDRGIIALAFWPDGKAVATGAWDSVARLWDVATGTPLGTPMGHVGSVTSLAFSPDGGALLSGCDDGRARLWDAASGTPIGSPAEHGRPLRLVAFAPDGHTFFTACEDGTARAWDCMPTWPTGRTLPHRNRRNVRMATAFSPDGSRLLTGTDDGSARLWDVATGQPVGPPMVHLSPVHTVAFRPDGLVAATGGEDGFLRLWDLASGKPIGRPWPQGQRYFSATFRPDGSALAVMTESGTVQLWEIATRRPLGAVMRHGSGLRAIDFSPDGKLLVTGAADGTTRTWDASTGEPIGPSIPHAGPIHRLAVSRDGRRFIAVIERGAVDLHSLPDGVKERTLLARDAWTGAISPDSRSVLTGSHNQAAQLWDIETGRQIGPPLVHGSAVLSVAFSPDGNFLLTGSSDRTARLWDRATGRQVGPPMAHPGIVRAVAFRPDGLGFFTAAETPKLWEIRRPLDGEPEQLAARVTALSGLRMDADRRIEVMDFRDCVASRGAPGSILVAPPPASVLAWHDLRAAWDEFADRPLGAMWHLDRLIAAGIDDWRLQVRRSRLADRLGDCDLSRSSILKALQSGPSRRHVLDLLLHQAIDASSEERWEVADRLLAQALDPSEDDGFLLIRRGTARARLGHWQEAASDYERASRACATNRTSDYRLALLQVRAGDHQGYRATCSRILRKSDAKTDPLTANSIAWACVVGPDGSADRGLPVRLARQALASASPEQSASILNTLGAALYRADRFGESIESTTRSITLEGRGGLPQDWAFLALAHSRQGHVEEARIWLDRLNRWSPTSAPGSFWIDLEIESLRAEARTVILPPK